MNFSRWPLAEYSSEVSDQILNHLQMKAQDYLQSNVLDIVFENRNKAYGAYVLRKEYDTRLIKAMGGTLALVLSLLLYSYLHDKFGNKNYNGAFKSTTVVLENHKDPAKPKEPEKPKPQEQKAKPLKQVQFVTPKIVIDKEADSLPRQIDIDKSLVGVKTTPGDTVTTVQPKQPPIVDPGDGDPKPKPQPQPEPPVFDIAEVMPQYPGGERALISFLQRHLQNPRDMDEGEKIVVRVRFVVNADGTVSDYSVTQSGSEAFDNEVLRVLRKMPNWKAGEQNGHKVAVYFTVPVVFMPAE
jgi:periplasmic protein TonB